MPLISFRQWSLALLLGFTACTFAKEPAVNLNSLAERYVRLTLAVGQHHPYYIDAYYGPKEWQPKQQTPLVQLKQQAEKLLAEVDAANDNSLRHAFMRKQLASVHFFIRQQLGEKLSFDQESMGLYDAKSPAIQLAQLDKALAELDQLLSGEQPLAEKLATFNQQFIIPTDKLDQVFTAAIDKARANTKQYIPLPEHENFVVEYVTDKVWSGYNWYQGNSFSIIQLNTDFPIYINRAIDLASHEGYPGHHVFNSQMEQHLVINNGWMEYSVYPLFSPMSLLAEGSANYGIDVAFEQSERLEFEREVLFPLAGMNPELVERYYQVQDVLAKLSYADNLVAQRYLDGEINKAQAIELLVKYTLVDEKKAQQRLGFIEANRAYVINYNLGQDIVKAYVQKLTAGQDIEKRWKIFAELLANPKTAAMMQE